MSKIVTVHLPDIGEGVREGEVIEWLKREGDPVKQDEPVVTVMTDKATVELPSPHPGKIAKHHYREGEIAIVDQPLYEIETEEKVAEKPKKKVKKPKKDAPKPALPRKRAGKVLAVPATRKLARDLGVDINTISGSGPDGRVVSADLRVSARGEAIVRFEGDREEPLSGIRRAMAEKMAESKRTIPHFSYFEFADATRLLQLRRNIKKQGDAEGVHVTFMPFFIRALSRTIEAFPILNSSVDSSSNTLIYRKSHNVGIAISSEGGLIVPVLKNVQEMGMEELIRAYETLKARAETKKLAPDEMKGGTVTISNFGVLGGGGRWATPIINSPEAAILAVAKIDRQPVVKKGEVVSQDTLKLSWSFDHRVIDGDLAASISGHYASLIENPAKML